MPTFYLHLCNGSGFTEDQEGSDYADLDAAHKAALDGLRDIMAHEVRGGELNLGSFIEIEDEDHKFRMTVAFSEAVHVTKDVGKRPS